MANLIDNWIFFFIISEIKIMKKDFNFCFSFKIIRSFPWLFDILIKMMLKNAYQIIINFNLVK